MRRFLLSLLQIPQRHQLQRNRRGKGQYIRDRLCRLHAKHAEDRRKKQQRRHQEESLPGNRQERGRTRTVNGLQHHVAGHNPAGQRESQTLKPQGQCTELNDIGIITEQRHQMRCQCDAQTGKYNQKYRIL